MQVEGLVVLLRHRSRRTGGRTPAEDLVGRHLGTGGTEVDEVNPERPLLPAGAGPGASQRLKIVEHL